MLTDTDTDTDAAVDAELLLAVARVLSELARHPRDPEEARRCLAELQARHPDQRLHLIPDEEAYDGSIHYAILVRQANALTLSLSAAAGPGLPWPLRGVARASEYDLLAVNGVRVSLPEALACIDGIFDDRRLLRTLVDSCLIGETLDEQPVEVSGSLLQETADAFRRAKKLYCAEATRTWLAERSLTEERFAELIAHQARARALRRRVAGGRVDAWFADHRHELDIVTAAWVALPASGDDPVEELKTDALGAILNAHRSGRDGGLAEWRVEELSEGLRSLAEAETGAVAPIEMGGAAVAVVLDRRHAVLDDATRDAVERRLFDAWLRERRRTAHVQWFWGNEARTAKATES
jgi:putative peptide maturation system protein